MRARKVDSNLTAIVEAARKIGFRVNVRNDDLADLDVQMGTYFVRHEVWEVKTANKGKRGKLLAARYTKRQKKRLEEGWTIYTVRTVEDVKVARTRFL